jgi:hypothetical protein
MAQVREALERARAAVGQAPETIAPLLVDAIGQIAAGLYRLAEAERNLAAQQALVDERTPVAPGTSAHPQNAH